MSDKAFFKPTNLYKEFMVLDLIEINKDITQRELASHLGIAVSMVNLLLDRIEKEGFIKRKKYNSKNVEYILSKKGIERRKVLNFRYLKNAQSMYRLARDNVISFLHQLELKGIRKLIFYGAGEVAELLIDTINVFNFDKINVVGVIDDDRDKIGNKIYNVSVVDLKQINEILHDGILISSHTNKDIIFNKLKNINYDQNKIFNFFET